MNKQTIKSEILAINATISKACCFNLLQYDMYERISFPLRSKIAKKGTEGSSGGTREETKEAR